MSWKDRAISSSDSGSSGWKSRAITAKEMGGSPPLGFVAEQVANLKPWDKANKFLKDDVAGFMAGETGYQGQKLENAGYPTAGRLVRGTGLLGSEIIAMAPEAIGSAMALKGIYNSSNPTVRGLVNTPQELGPQYTAQDAVIGVTRRVPQEGGRFPQFQKPELQGLATKSPRPLLAAEPLPQIVPERLPGKPGDFMAYANDKLAKFGDKINPQELMDWKVKLQTDMSNGVIPKIDKQTGGITTIYQQATNLLSKIKGVFNPLAERKLLGTNLPSGTIQTRAGLDKAYGIASKLQQGTRKGAKLLGAGLGIAGVEEFVRRKFFH